MNDFPEFYLEDFDRNDETNENYIHALLKTLPIATETVLTEKQKFVVSMIIYEQKSQTEIANLLNINQSAVSHTYYKAISKLQKYMSIVDFALKEYIRSVN